MINVIILAISDSHESHACILINGKIVSAIAEERLSRLKTDSGYPHRAIEKVILEAGIKKSEIDLVVFAGEKAGLFHTLLNPQPNLVFKIGFIKMKSIGNLN